MVTVRIDEDDLLDMLINRVEYWTDDYVTIHLFEKYYCNMIEDGCFEGAELNIMGIVDNDYINYFKVIYEDDFRDYNIEDEEDDRIVATTLDNEEQKAYLISCY